MKFNFAAVLLITILISACSRTASIVISEPAGREVVLAQEEFDKLAKLTQDEFKAWAAWHLKGIALVKENDFEGALFCFHRAVENYPKNASQIKTAYSEKAKEIARSYRVPESIVERSNAPTDTILQKGYLYLKMNRPDLAAAQFEEFLKHRPGASLAEKGLEEARSKMN